MAELKYIAERYYLCAGGKHQLEIIKGEELRKPFYDKTRYRVIGGAGGRADAFELVRRVVEDFVSSGRGIDELRNYLQETQDVD